MSTLRIAALIPCYNTSAACRPVIAGTLRACDVVLAVDDGSTDDTAAHLAASSCEVLTLPRNLGKGGALEAGIRWLLNRNCGGTLEAILILDGDGQHAAGDIPRFLDAARRSGADLVIGVRDPASMPRKNRIGAHFSRLLFLIGTSRFVPDTQCGFRLMSAALLHELLDGVTWRGYETESEVLWRALDRSAPVAAVPISTIYIDGNRRSQFRAWRDSSRIAAVFAPQIAWTVAMAWVDVALFAILVRWPGLPPAAANLVSRPAAVAIHLLWRRDGPQRLRTLARQQGVGWTAAAFAGHLALTTVLIAGLAALGTRPILAKVLGQLTGYLGGFAVADRVMFRRAVGGRAAAGTPERGREPPGSPDP